MKIRTDFVTNSSSYCTTEVIIDNPVLLKILQKYKDMGLLGDNDPIIGIGVYESQDEQFSPDDYQDYTKTPAFFYCEKQNDEDFGCLFLVSYCPCPKTLDEVLNFIIYIIDCADEYLNGQIRTELKVELDQRKEEINSAYSSVLWKTSQSANCNWYLEFKFDPINGSSFIDKDDNHVPTTEIAIDNPLLLEILQKYKDMGLFRDKSPIIGIGGFDSTDLHWDGYKGPKLSGIPAFYYYEQEGVLYDESLKLARFAPKKLINVVEKLILIMENGAEYLDEQFLALLKDETSQRKDKINQAFSRVYWSYRNGTQGEKFEYDPINGESYEKRDDDFDEENEEDDDKG